MPGKKTVKKKTFSQKMSDTRRKLSAKEKAVTPTGSKSIRQQRLDAPLEKLKLRNKESSMRSDMKFMGNIQKSTMKNISADDLRKIKKTASVKMKAAIAKYEK